MTGWIDAHHHLWDLTTVHYPWLMARGVERFFGDPTPIQRDYMLREFRSEAAPCGVGASVHIQVGAESGPDEARWVQSVADAKAEASYDDEFSDTNARAAAMKAAEMARAAKSLGGQIRTSGCIIDGSFRVNRVPGAFYVTPHSMGHNLNPDVINMTHTVKHLSFGKHVPGRPSYVPRNLRRVWKRVPKDLGGRFAAGDEATFYSEEPNTVHEHYLKIVSRTFEPLEGQAVQLYEYTFNSNRFRLNPPLAADGDPDQHVDGPMIKLSYDVSPMSVVLKEVKKPLLDWILGMCALLGGVYTCAGLLETFLQSSVCAVKRRVGKIS